MTPRDHYQHDLARAGFVADAAQAAAVEHLQRLFDELVETHRPVRAGGRWRHWLGTPQSIWQPVTGLYFWGGVGRGKTYLMDLFCESLPFEQRQRTHFHRFMRHVHHELKALAGEKNPLVQVARRLAGRVRVLCFDEFFVTDITDAMILAGLLDELFRLGVTLVATSNIVPDELYRDGLQRSRFLPAIALLNRHTHVLNVDGGVDYRLRALQCAELYHWPLDDQADASLIRSLKSLAPEQPMADVALEVEGRKIRTRWLADDVAWFDFDELCGGPRSQNDYIELAREFHAVLVSNVPCLDKGRDDQARRFIHLVDEFYDRNVKLVISAEVPLEGLYRQGRLSFAFERTQSRLLEMQSHAYLGRQHRP